MNRSAKRTLRSAFRQFPVFFCIGIVVSLVLPAQTQAREMEALGSGLLVELSKCCRRRSGSVRPTPSTLLRGDSGRQGRFMAGKSPKNTAAAKENLKFFYGISSVRRGRFVYPLLPMRT